MFVFFFKQKTAYEVRISDWSSDVCSSDLLSTGLTDPFGLVMEKVLSPTVAICNGRETILLGTYNYMGMTFDEDVIAAGKQAFEDFGAGTTEIGRASCRERVCPYV